MTMAATQIKAKIFEDLICDLHREVRETGSLETSAELWGMVRSVSVVADRGLILFKDDIGGIGWDSECSTRAIVIGQDGHMTLQGEHWEDVRDVILTLQSTRMQLLN